MVRISEQRRNVAYLDSFPPSRLASLWQLQSALMPSIHDTLLLEIFVSEN
jgi:hypothetical protein